MYTFPTKKVEIFQKYNFIQTIFVDFFVFLSLNVQKSQFFSPVGQTSPIITAGETPDRSLKEKL